MIATLLTLAGMLLFVLFPALIPAAVHVVYALRNRQPAGRLRGRRRLTLTRPSRPHPEGAASVYFGCRTAGPYQ